MPIDRISANQFAADIQAGILGRDDSWDVTEGEVPDTTIYPQARVFERQHADVRKVSLMMTLSAASEFNGVFAADLENIVFNEGLTRTAGAQVTANVVFSRSSPPTSDVRVQRGFPIASAADTGTGTTLTFVTTEERTMLAAAASSYYNVNTERYEITIPVVALVVGTQARVGPNRVNRPLRPLVGFDSVTNVLAAAGGRDEETNQALIDRYLIAIIGRRLSTRTGIEKVVVDDYPDVEDVLVVAGTDALLTRAGDTAGAVDAYIIGRSLLERTENPAFPGRGQLIRVAFSPMTEVSSVQDLSTGTTFVEGTDYDVVYDTTGLAGSSRALDGVLFRFTGSAPTVGAPVTITYTYNNLIRLLQAAFATDDMLCLGRDLLFKQGTEIPLVLTYELRVVSGFDSALVQNAVDTAILNFIADLKLGDAVEMSDIQGIVRQISGVDNFIFTRLTRSTVPSGIADVGMDASEYPTLADGDLSGTLI